jgi:hypothetical protein
MRVSRARFVGAVIVLAYVGALPGVVQAATPAAKLWSKRYDAGASTPRPRWYEP